MNEHISPGSLLKKIISSNDFGNFFGVSQEVLDKVWSRLTSDDRNSVMYISMEIGADPDVYNPVRDYIKQNDLAISDDPGLQSLLDKYTEGPEKIPVYSGGLGVLAGDTLKSLADNHIPVAALSLLYKEGYFSQLVDLKVGQIDHATFWKPAVTPTLFPLHEPEKPAEPLTINVPFFKEGEGETAIPAQVWVKLETSGNLDYFVPEFLLDYNLPSAPDWVQEASRQLYSAKSPVVKANQRRLLGSGVLPLMQKLGLTARTIHLNEQHGVAVTLHLMMREVKSRLGSRYAELLSDKDILDIADRVSEQLVYTIHTPVKAGHDRFNRSMYDQISQKAERKILNLLAGDEDSHHEYNFTSFAMRVNRAVNSVSRLHRDVTRRQFPRFADKINAITNGVHLTTWASEERCRVFDASPLLENWRNDPGIFVHAPLQDDSQFRQQLLTAWQNDNHILINYINGMLNKHRAQMAETWIEPPNYLSHLMKDGYLEPDVYTVGFARRFSTYKRADLIFDDIKALADILVRNNWRVNFLFAGKAHPSDEPGKNVLKMILQIQEELYGLSNGLAKLVFIPGYDMAIAKMMVSGSHSWLNSPKRPLEASGTSGMKAAMNGVPNISVMDGWWVEGYHDGKTGWKFGYAGPVADANLSEDPDTLLYEEDSDSFYQLLPTILQTFYENPDRYLDIAINNLRLNVPIFNTHRMVAEYVQRYELQLDEATGERIKRFQQLYQSEVENI